MHLKKFDELRLTGALPSPSSVGLRILEITRDESFDKEELVKVIMGDPALSGRILKVANSVDKAPVEPIVTVGQAVVRLGANVIRSVALGFTLISDNRIGRAEHFDYEAYWSRSVAMAVAGSVLAFELKLSDSADAFTCGLLCNIGKLAFASIHPERYGRVLDQNPQISDRVLLQLETSTFDINHTEVAAAMMLDWGLPTHFQRAVLIHENPRSGSADDMNPVSAELSALLRAAENIADVLHLDRHTSGLSWMRAFFGLEESAQDLGISVNTLYALTDTIAPSWQEWGDIIGVPTRLCRPLAEIAAELEAEGITEAPSEPDRVHLEEDPDSWVNTLEDTSFEEIEISREDEKLRILVVDDDEMMLRVIRHHLNKEGYEILTASSSDLGLRMAMSDNPQMVVTDWMMPGMTGVELCKTLRQTEAGRKTYVLIVTARENDEQVVEAFSAGADDYVVKPFNPRVLLARVRAGQRMIEMREKVEDSERAQLRQVAELGILNRKLRAAAMTDALTALPNRRYAMNRLKQEWNSALRTGKPLSVIMADIDFFKKVNDVYGHDAGDVVLREVAHVLRQNSRGADILARLGGEEFLSINVTCDVEMAAACAERLREAIQNHRIPYDGFDQQITMSFGVAQRTSEMQSVDDLIKAADDALYVAKDTGRNRVSHSGEDEDMDQGDIRRTA